MRPTTTRTCSILHALAMLAAVLVAQATARAQPDPPAGELYRSLDVEALLPPGFAIVKNKNFVQGEWWASQTFTHSGDEYHIRLEHEPSNSAEPKAADRYNKWFAPSANNVEEVYEKNLGLGEASVSLRVNLPPSRSAHVYHGPWTLTVRQKAGIDTPESRKYRQFFSGGGTPRFTSEDQAVAEMEDLARQIWTRFEATQPMAPAPARKPKPAAAPTPTPPPPPPAKPDPEPVRENVPDPEPEVEVRSANLSEQDRRHLDRIAQLDRILQSVEQPLQERLTKIRLIAQSLDHKRAEMRRLARMKRELADEALLEKIQARINLNRDLLTESAAELRTHTEEARRVARDALAAIQAILSEEGFGDLSMAALTRRELMEARAKLLEAQLAFNSGDLEAAQRAAEAMRADFRLRGHASYIDGMALLQQGKTLDALASFRNAREAGSTPISSNPGDAFEALERRVEIHVLENLRGLSVETARAFDQDHREWISARAELDRPADETTLEWLTERFLKRSWYDTVSGINPAGIGEADERGREAGIVADDMAVTHVGLTFIIALRQERSLAELRSLDTEGLRRAAADRWGRELPEDQIVRMRRAIRHAFQLPELKSLAEGTAHLDRSAFAGRLADRIELQDRWATAGEIGAMGGSLVNGWTMLTTFAPSAKLSFAGTGTLVRAKDASERFKNTVTLGEWFAASRPVEGALRSLNETRAGRAALQTAARMHEFSERGVPESLAVLGANMVIDGGAAYAAQEYLGEPGAMLVDAFSSLGGTNPELYGQALRKMTRQQVLEAAQTMARHAAHQRRHLQRLDDVLRDLPDVGTDTTALSTFRRTLDNTELDAATVDRVEGLAAAIESGNTALVQQARRDLDRLRTRQVLLADQAETASRQLRTAAPAAADPPATVTRVREPDAGGTVVVSDPSSTATGAASGTRRVVGDPLQPDAAGTARAGGASRSADGAGTRRGAGADEPFVTIDPNDARARQSAVNTGDSLNLGTPYATEADRLLADRRFDDAIDAYQRQLLDVAEDSPLRERLEAKLQLAQESRDAARKIDQAQSAGPSAAPPAKILDRPNAEAVVQDIVNGPNASELWVPVNPSNASASKPRYVYSPDGQKLAVTKTAVGTNPRLPGAHPEGRAEVLASLLSEKLGRATPRSRTSSFTATIDGAPQQLIITDLMPDGTPLGDLAPTTAQLMARKDDIAEDFVFAMLLGDGDRHLGNLWITPDERLIGFDYGLADIVREHPYRFSEFVEATQPRYDRAKRQLDELLAIPTPSSQQLDQIDRLRQQMESLQSSVFYHDLDLGAAVPGPGDPGFHAFVEGAMRKHMRHGSRSWKQFPLFDSAMSIEDFLPHIQRLEDALGDPRVLDEIVNTAMDGHPDIEHTRALLRKRLEIMRSVFESRFPTRVGSLGTPALRPIDLLTATPRRAAA